MTAPAPAQQQHDDGAVAASVAAALAMLEARLLAAARSAAVEVATGTATGWKALLTTQTRSRLLVRQFMPQIVAAARGQAAAAEVAGRNDMLAQLSTRGVPVAVHPAARAPHPTDMVGLPGVDAIVARMITDLTRAGAQVTRSQDGVYRKLVAAVIERAMPSTQARLDAAQQVLDDYADTGIIALVDKLGRRWNLTTYMSMVARTAATHARAAAAAQALLASGQNVVVVTTRVHCCDKCAPFDGQLLAIGPTTTPVAATMAEAIEAGLLHPNCRCSIGPWTPGDPLPDPSPAPDPDDLLMADVAARARVGMRAAHRRRALALTPRAAAKALGRLRFWRNRLP
jgi:hypothetical protein